jgi:hypothetical protein
MGAFPDRSQRLFGRQPDLDALALRAGTPGLTAVIGRPQIGKTWLLAELARQLSETKPAHLVGLAESREGEPDLPLRAIVDLYARWLEQSGFGKQAAMVWAQQKGDLLKAITSAVKEIGKAFGEAALKPAYSALDGLHAANDKLKSGLQLPALQYDQAQGLLQAVHGVSGQKLVLILDQWENHVGSARRRGCSIRSSATSTTGPLATWFSASGANPTARRSAPRSAKRRLCNARGPAG